MKKSKIKKVIRKRINYKLEMDKLRLALANAVNMKDKPFCFSTITLTNGIRFFIMTEEQLNNMGVRTE